MDAPTLAVAKFVRDSGIKLTALSKKTGVPYSALQPSMSGRRKLRADEFLEICDFYAVDPRNFVRSTTQAATE